MGVEDPEAPRGDHEQADPGEHDPHQRDGELEPLPDEPGGDETDQRAGEQDPSDRQRSDEHHQQAEHGTGDATGLFLAVLGQQPRVGRDERGGQHTLTQEVLEQVRDLQRGPERIGTDVGPQEERERGVAQQPRQAGQRDPRRDQRGGTAHVRRALTLGRVRRARSVVAGRGLSG